MFPDSSSPGVCVFVYAYVSILAVVGVILYGPALISRGCGNEAGGGGAVLAGRRLGRPASSPALQLALEEGGAASWDEPRPFVGASPNHRGYGARNGSGSLGAEGSGGEGAGRVFECSAVHSASDLEFLAGGWTKAVYRAKVWGRDVAIKTVNLNGKDMRVCQRAGGSQSACYRRASAKILREMVLLGQLRHDNIVEVLGSCIPIADFGPVAMVTELGDPLDTIRLLQLSWEDRLRLSLGMARILHRLAHSPLGSLAMNDFRRQQFVTVGGTTLKLSDVDDVGVTEPSCTSADDCLQRLPSEMRNESSGVDHSSSPCIEGRCIGHNEKLNVWHAGRHFIRLFLPLSAPSTLEPHIQDLLEAYKTAKWDSEQILKATERLVASFISKDYREAGTVDHEKPRPEMVSGAYDIPEG